MKSTINIGGRLFDLSEPRVMGIVNVTPDSFYADSRVLDDKLIVQRINDVVSEGADIIDIGGYSTRPNASQVEVEVEIERVLSAVKILKRDFGDFPFSVDTFRGDVVRAVYDKYGDFVVNDVAGGTLDDSIISMAGKYKLPYIMGHIKGTPATMKTMTDYEDLLQEVLDFFVKRLEYARSEGVVDVIIDPCFGFAKNIEQNFTLLKHLDYFNVLELPLLAGLSRKSMIYNTLKTTPCQALNGTSALNILALLNGAKILRVHDVAEAVEVVKLYNCYAEAE